MNEQLKQALETLGFNVWDTGGNCTAWGINLPGNTGHILITDGDGGATHDIDDVQSASIGIYDAEGYEVCGNYGVKA